MLDRCLIGAMEKSSSPNMKASTCGVHVQSELQYQKHKSGKLMQPAHIFQSRAEALLILACLAASMLSRCFRDCGLRFERARSQLEMTIEALEARQFSSLHLGPMRTLLTVQSTTSLPAPPLMPSPEKLCCFAASPKS